MSSLFHHPVPQNPEALQDPSVLRARLEGLKGRRDALQSALRQREERLSEVECLLELAPKVEAALQLLSQEMFYKLVGLLEHHLTQALQEVLEQPIALRARTQYKHGSATVEFYVERDGEEEHIMRGQGGSVANILSVGLRMFALAQLPEDRHRRFLVLDEPDGWLRPELVPRLVKIIRDAGRALGFQVLLISHHELEHHLDLVDRTYAFEPQPDGSVKVVHKGGRPRRSDEDEDEPPAEPRLPPDSLFELR
ncbi:MAG TPA: hypothetical protein VM328_11905 [Fimbriimonadaceae bacterium]|nr:hypothetical protein [Fimbriimonadaceae bacterium]